ncbi:hypothetical protein [Methylobacterium nigriterrae]|uniref:hypothetical protein n=1 Tax=Methylobacterium nigriterrae TaxID=3127512 RepID=UPI0030141718
MSWPVNLTCAALGLACTVVALGPCSTLAAARERFDGDRRIERAPAAHRQKSHAHHRPRRHLPPEIAYRDPAYRPQVPLGPPAVIVRGYLPRNHAVPMYNEPPAPLPRY